MIFVRFIDGSQVEAIQRNTSPGEDWIASPPGFDWNKRYKLVDGEFVEMSSEEIEQLYQEQLTSSHPEIPDNSENVEISEYPEGGSNA
jgi:hypothetical protein